MKKTIAILLTISLCFSLCACGKSAEAKKADELILAIGEVTADSENSILAAQTYYDTLSDKQKEEVENYQILIQAQEEYSKIANRILLETNIQSAYGEEKWATVLTLSKEYLASYPSETFAEKAQQYKEDAIDMIGKGTIAYLKAGDLKNGKLLLEAIKDDVNGADALLEKIEEYSMIAGKYTASEYSRKKSGNELPYQGTREAYNLTVIPFIDDSGEWQVQYTVEVPGIFNLAGKGCFTYTCVGNAYSSGNVPVAIEIDPQIDTWNTRIIESDTIQIYSTDGGYLVVHTIYYKSSSDYEEISQSFIKQ